MTEQNTYDRFSEEYVAMVSYRDEDKPWHALEKAFFDLIGDVEGLRVLDAGCGEGYVARVLEKKGAIVTAVDVSRKLVEKGKGKVGSIDYLVADLSEGLPQFEGQFDLVADQYPVVVVVNVDIDQTVGACRGRIQAVLGDCEASGGNGGG